ncbi:MAG TPA: SDR family oxidoreductase [Spirochaetota bacterium]|nr:SDR family oxidoreductase [Spirochaetota bacterium]
MDIPFRVDLSGKVAVITGGAGVLCGVFAEALAGCGARVAILDLNEDAAVDRARRIGDGGGRAIGVTADVLEAGSLRAAAERVRMEFGRCDILINGAGGNHPKGTTAHDWLSPGEPLSGSDSANTFFDLDRKSVEFVFGLNFIGTLLATQEFARDMVDRGGTVINVSSMNALRPLTRIPAYSAAKAAVSNFTQWLAVYLAKVNVRVNAMAPGFFLTEQNRALLVQPDGTPTPRAGKILAHTPMGRFGMPEELVGTLLWLVDERASGFVTGTVIPVDGGFSAYSGV